MTRPFSPSDTARRRRFPVSLFLFACALSLFASATTRAQVVTDDDVERVESNLVRLNVGVADPKGRAVTNLSRDDFAVFEDGVRQQIQSFEPTAAPFSLVLLLDLSGSTLSFRSTLRQSAIRFLDALAPEDRVAVIAFSTKLKGSENKDRIEILEDFTTDRRQTAYAISDATGAGQTILFKALRFSLEQLAKEGAKRRKAVIVLTDGVDTSLRNADRKATADAKTDAEAIASIKPEASETLRGVLDAADRQGVTIYPLALPNSSPKRFFAITPQEAGSYAAARARLHTLADRTGGRLHEINRLEEMGRLYAEVAADMRTLYTIAYQSTGDRKAGGGKWRAINIELPRQTDLIARTRPGYYAR